MNPRFLAVLWIPSSEVTVWVGGWEHMDVLRRLWLKTLRSRDWNWLRDVRLELRHIDSARSDVRTQLEQPDAELRHFLTHRMSDFVTQLHVRVQVQSFLPEGADFILLIVGSNHASVSWFG